MIMIKKYALNKIAVATLCLILLGMFYFIPSSANIETNVEENKNKTKENVVYLLDEDNYVSRVTTFYDEKDITEDIKKKLDILINGNEDINEFYPLIPKTTKINSVKVDKDSVYIDFNKDILKVNKYLEESMIESIVYTLTEINGIEKIYITIDQEKLTKLPNSNKELPYPLTRNIGINKEYNITSFDNIDKTTVFFLKENNDESYFVPVTKISNVEAEKIDIIIEELKSSVNAQNNLNGYITDNVELVSFNKTDDKIDLVFNSYIFTDNKILESVEYVISKSIFENYDVNEVTFSSEDKENIDTVKKDDNMNLNNISNNEIINDKNNENNQNNKQEESNNITPENTEESNITNEDTITNKYNY